MKNKQINITLDEMKKIELEILGKIDEICRKNNLKYSLAAGTLIGAIRHKGFIPWDDDIDIMMPRPDYEKLKQILLKNPVEGLKYMSSDTQYDFYYPFAKVVSTQTTIKEYKALEIKDYGVFVDVFPIDGVYQNRMKRFFQVKSLKILRNLIQISFHEEEISNSKIKRYIKQVIAIFSKKVGFKRWVEIANKIMKKCDYNNSEYVTELYNDISIKRNRIYQKYIYENVSYKQFEDKKFLVLDNYDKYLKDLFGNYMELPPIESQKSNHDFDRLMWKDVQS